MFASCAKDEIAAPDPAPGSAGAVPAAATLAGRSAAQVGEYYEVIDIHDITGYRDMLAGEPGEPDDAAAPEPAERVVFMTEAALNLERYTPGTAPQETVGVCF